MVGENGYVFESGEDNSVIANKIRELTKDKIGESNGNGGNSILYNDDSSRNTNLAVSVIFN